MSFAVGALVRARGRKGGTERALLAEDCRDFLARALDDIPALTPAFEKVARENAARILTAHERVREAVKAKGVRHRVERKLPVDVLGVYVYLPEGAA